MKSKISGMKCLGFSDYKTSDSILVAKGERWRSLRQKDGHQLFLLSRCECNISDEHNNVNSIPSLHTHQSATRAPCNENESHDSVTMQFIHWGTLHPAAAKGPRTVNSASKHLRSHLRISAMCWSNPDPLRVLLWPKGSTNKTSFPDTTEHHQGSCPGCDVSELFKQLVVKLWLIVVLL